MKKITSLLLILLVVGYSGGMHIAKHLCDGEVVAKAWNHKVKVCKKASSSTPFSEDHTLSELSCCKTVVDFLHSDNFSKSHVAFDFFNVPTQIPEIVIVESASSAPAKHFNFTPPLNGPPIYKVFGQYLI